MANSTADGSVVIDVNMDVSDAEHELARLKKKILHLESDLDEKTFKRGGISSELIQARKELKKLQSEKPATLIDGAFADNSEYYEKLAAAEKTVFELDQQLKKIDEDISAGELALEYTKMRYGEILPIAQQLRKEEEARAASEKQAKEEAKQAEQKAKEEAKRQGQIAKEAQAAIEAQIAQQRLLDIKENAAVSDQRLVDLQEELLSLTKRRKELESAGVGFGYQEYDDIAKRTSEINTELREYQDNLINLNAETEKLGKSTTNTNKAVKRMGGRIMELAKSAFIFNVISRALTSLQQLTTKYIKTNDEARQAIAQMKGALLTLAQPLIEVIIPAFVTLVNILTKIITMAAQLVSALFGKTVKQSKDGAKALYKEANAIGAVGEAADEAAGSLAGFDEIDPINTENAKGAGGVGGSGDEIMPDFDFSPGKYKDMIDELMVYLSGALLVIGAILLFSGANIPLGLGLMVLGAAVLAQEIAENWGAVDGKVRDAVNRMLIILGGALLVIGAILCFTGANIPLGLGLMVVGAAMLAAAVALNWGSMSAELQNALLTLLQIIGPMIAIIGVILAVSGHLLLGIGLIIAGIALFEIGNAGKEDGDFVENIRSRLTEALGIIGSLIAVVGLILLVTGHILLGLGLIIAGIALFEYAKVSDDDGKTIEEKITTVLKETAKIAGTFLLVLGLILLFVPGSLPLALGLIATGAIGLVAGISPDWGFIQKKIGEIWKDFQNWWDQNVSKYLTADWWKEKGIEVIDGLLGGLKDAWDGLTSWFSGVWDNLFGNRKVSVDVDAKSSAGNYNSSPRVSSRSIPEIATYNIPALARGAVIPPNREFLAVLGDQRSGNNLEAPEGLIRKIFREESGGANESVIMLLQSLLEAVKDGHVIMVDGTVFGRTAIRTINGITTATGRQQLKL